jgi:hypothetical protein
MSEKGTIRDSGEIASAEAGLAQPAPAQLAGAGVPMPTSAAEPALTKKEKKGFFGRRKKEAKEDPVLDEKASESSTVDVDAKPQVEEIKPVSFASMFK